MSCLKKLSHTVWDCKYYLVWCPKYRFRVMENAIRYYVRDVLRELCRRHKVEILEGNVQFRGDFKAAVFDRGLEFGSNSIKMVKNLTFTIQIALVAFQVDFYLSFVSLYWDCQ